MLNEPQPHDKGAGLASLEMVPPVVDAIEAQAKAKTDFDTVQDIKRGTVEDLDEAQLFLHEHGIPNSRLEELMSDEVGLNKLRRRVDWFLMPLLCGTYLLQYIDKQALGYSAVFDLFTSTGMTADQYSWMASIFYFAYLASEWPASYVAQHYPTGKVVAGFVLTWGVVLLCTAAANNFAGLAVCRFLLGVFESVITPAFMLIVSQWFTREKQPARAGLFYCFNGIGSMSGSIIFYGVGQAKGWDVWRIIYILCGGLTVVWGIVLWFRMPDNILTSTRFTTEERAMLIAQNVRGRGGVFSRTIKKHQILEVFRDPQVWLLFWYMLFNEIINGGIAAFSKLIVKGFTHDPLLTTVYGIPYGALTAIYMFSGPYVASRFKNTRTIVMIVWLLPTLIAVCLFWQLPRSNKGGLLAGYYMVRRLGSLTTPLRRGKTNLVIVFLVCRRTDCRPPDARLQRRRIHQEDDRDRLCFPRLLRRQHHRAPRLPWLGGARLPDRL